MSKYDDAKKGARFTMCQAALQGGADVSIVPKVMDRIFQCIETLTLF